MGKIFDLDFGFSIISAFEREAAGAGELDDAVGLEQAEERRDFFVVAGGFHDQRIGGEVDDLRPEDVFYLENLRARPGVGADFHEHEFARDGLAFLEIDDLNNIDELPELLDAQVELSLITAEDRGDAGQRRIVRGSNVERVDVEAAAGKHSRN